MKRTIVSALTRKSLADITRRKGRALFVIAGVFMGVCGLTAINGAASVIQAALTFDANRAAQPNIDLAVRSVSPALAPALQGAPNVRVVQIDTLYNSRWQITATPGHVNIAIYSFQDPARVALHPFQLVAGRLPGSGEIVMESSDRGLQAFALGDSVRVAGAAGPVALRVVGLARTPGEYSAATNGRALAYMSADGLSALSGAQSANDIEVQVADKRLEQQTTRDLVAVLRAHDVTLLNAASLDGAFEFSPINGIFTIMRVLSAIALLLSGFLIINTVTTLLAEQTAIIGTMKALGGGRGAIMRGYLTTVGAYGVIGTALGVGAGVAGAYALTQYLNTVVTLDTGPFRVDPAVMLLSVAVGLGVPLAAAIAPLWAGTAMTVRAALTGYGMSAGGARRQARAHARRSWLPQTARLSLRGVFRRRARAILTLLALTLSGSAFLAISTTAYSLDGLLTQLFSQYDADAFVNTSPAPYAQLRAQFLASPNVARVERLEQVQVKTRWGSLLLTATEVNPRLYHYQLLAGRLFTADDTNALLLSDIAAAHSGLKVGDTITLSSATNTATWTIIGEVHDLNGGLGSIGDAFTSVANLHALDGEPADLASGFMAQGADRSGGAVDRMATQLDDRLAAAGLDPSVSTRSQEIARNHTQFQILYVLLYSVAIIVGLVGALSLFNTLTTSVLERRREMGMLRSLGATGRTVASVFWVEGLTLAMIAWLTAVALGIPAAYGFVRLLSAVLSQPLPFAFDPASLLSMLAVILVIATVASALPALGAARLRIAEILRYE